MGYVKRDSIQWIIGQVFEGWMTPEEKKCKTEFQKQLDAIPDENVVPVSVRPEQEGCNFCRNHEEGDTLYESSDWDGGIGFDYICDIKFCPICGSKLRGEEEEEPVKEDIIKDCRTCGFGHYNDHWGQNMCYDPDPTGHGCVMWSHWIPKEKSE